MTNSLTGFILSLMWWGFIAVKLAGHVFAAWSWWWLLMAPVPWLALLVEHFHL